jgi:predicted flap endonuclease-1-like 5' DNA nuclease
MVAIFNANIAAIVAALLIGLVTGWWLFKHSRETGNQKTEPSARSEVEGNSLCDEGAAAVADVAGEVLGVSVHDELSGASGLPGNLELLKGIGPKFVTKLNENGVTRFDQLARLSSNEITILDNKLGPFKGRLVRDRLVEQAGYLARGDIDGFEAKFGKLGGN